MSSRERQLVQTVRQVMAGWEAMGDDLRRIRQARRRPADPVPVEPVRPVPALEQALAAVHARSPAELDASMQAVAARADALLARVDEAVPTPSKPRDSRPEPPADRVELDEDLLPSLLGEVEDLHEAIQAHLSQWREGDTDRLPDLRRQIHTLKGLVRMVGARSLGDRLHRMETDMEEVEAGSNTTLTPDEIAQQYDAVRGGWQALLRPAPVAPESASAAHPPLPSTRASGIIPPSQVRVTSTLIDRLITETNEARLTTSALEGAARTQRDTLRDLGKTDQGLGRLLRDLEVYAETQIQSRRAQLAPGEEFDPLEMDRYTVLQELSRSLTEAGTDAMDLHRDLSRQFGEQENLLAYQSRALGEVQSGLHQTRLTPVDDSEPRLKRVVWSTSHEVGKEVEFILDSGHLDLDRVLLDRVYAPLEHILRNAVDHGLETPAMRRAAGKPEKGTITIRVRQQAGRVSFEVQDDGAGLNVARVRSKAVEKGLWAADRPMATAEAADMICQPGFSTASVLTQTSGRGVGMDVVRSEVLGMGGRFEIHSVEGRGMTVTLQLPTVVATASVLIVHAGGERWAVPVDLVEDIERHPHAVLAQAEQAGQWADGSTFADLAVLMGLDPSPRVGTAGNVLWLREGTRRVVVQVDDMDQVAEVPLRPAGALWAGTEGVAGVTVLPDGQATFLIDPLRARGHRDHRSEAVNRPRQPTVLVVDDSITVRKATVRFLEKEGYHALTAKDGQEALEVLALGAAPDVVLLDVEMPRMNGFDCLKAIRQSPLHRQLPVIMITSRTAPKHRQRAEELGIQGYLGKPFKEDELAERLAQLIAP